MSISPTKRKQPIEEERNCGGCDRPESNCYCRIVECICCGGTDHRYNMRSNDSDEEDSDDWHDQMESDEEEY